MTRIRRWSALTPLMTALLAVQGCGGGGGGDATSATTTSTYQVTGTVPGTLIEAFCDDGTYYKTTSVDNGTTSHPFTLSLPNGVACQLVMTMNENDPDNASITPVAYVTSQGRAIALKGASTTAVNLGYVDLPDATAGEVTVKDTDGNGTIDPHERLTQKIEVNLTGAAVEVVPETVALNIDPDHDGVPSHYDDDDDNDGIKDWDDDDDDGDGIKDVDEHDSDGDGVEDVHDRDDDNDGTEDASDPDYRENSASFSVTSAPVTFTLPQSYTPDSTGARLLAAQCAQCHGTNGYSVSSFEGLAAEAGEVLEEILEYHYKSNYDIMAAQAKAYTAAEARLMQGFFQNMASQYGVRDGGDDDHDDDRYDDDDD